MNGETATWLCYAEENLAVARLSLEQGFLNACLQNAQQCVEKALKAMVIEKGLAFRKTHSIQELAGQLAEVDLDSGLSEDECDLIDAIYLPSKYPMASVAPDMEPNAELCSHCLAIAERVLGAVRQQLGPTTE